MSALYVIGCSALLLMVLIITKLVPCFLAAICFEHVYSRWNCVRKCSTRYSRFLLLCIGIRILLPSNYDDYLCKEFDTYITRQCEDSVKKISVISINQHWFSDIDFTYPFGIASRVNKLEKRIEKLEKKISKYEKI